MVASMIGFGSGESRRTPPSSCFTARARVNVFSSMLAFWTCSRLGTIHKRRWEFFPICWNPPFPFRSFFYFYPSGNLKAILTPPSKLSTSFMDGPLHHKRSKRALGWQNHEYQNPLVVNLEKKWLLLGGDLGGSNFIFLLSPFFPFLFSQGEISLKKVSSNMMIRIHYSIVNYTVVVIHFLLFLIQFFHAN